MTLRDHITADQAWAHAVLDDVRAGLVRSAIDINTALRLLGDM